MIATGASKGKALEELAAFLGISLSETAGIGNGSNDIPLLSRAGLALAMGNSPEELKAVADFVVSDVESSGVAEATERFILPAAG